MERHERVPKTIASARFPVGDINPTVVPMMNTQIASFQEKHNSIELRQTLALFREAEIERWQNRNHQEKNYEAIKSLGDNWGYTMMKHDANFGKYQFCLGFENIIAFVHHNALFSTNFNDFSIPLKDMEMYDTGYIESFVNESQEVMLDSHPRLYQIITQLTDLTINTPQQRNDPRARTLLEAGAGLAYLMIAMTRMENSFKDELEDDRVEGYMTAFIQEKREDEQ